MKKKKKKRKKKNQKRLCLSLALAVGCMVDQREESTKSSRIWQSSDTQATLNRQTQTQIHAHTQSKCE